MYDDDYRIHLGALRRVLGFRGSKIPANAQGTWTNLRIPTCNEVHQRPEEAGGWLSFCTDVILRPSVTPANGHKSSAHRLFVKCPHCRKMVPAGRLHQHIGTGTCKAGDVKRAAKVNLQADQDYPYMLPVGSKVQVLDAGGNVVDEGGVVDNRGDGEHGECLVEGHDGTRIGRTWYPRYQLYVLSLGVAELTYEEQNEYCSKMAGVPYQS